MASFPLYLKLSLNSGLHQLNPNDLSHGDTAKARTSNVLNYRTEILNAHLFGLLSEVRETTHEWMT